MAQPFKIPFINGQDDSDTEAAPVAAAAPAQIPTIAPPAGQIPTIRPQYQPNQDRLQQIRSLQQQAYKQENPTAPTGFWGKAGHILSNIGNAAGNVILGANNMTNIPGTQLHNAAVHSATENEIGGLENEERADENQFEKEQAGQDESALRGAQTKKIGAETEELENKPAVEPNLQQLHANAVNKAIQEGRDPSEDPTVQHLADAITSLQKQPTEQGVGKTTDIKGPDGKIHTMGYNPKSGKYDIEEGESGFKPPVTNVNAGLGALDRETTRLAKPYEKGVSDANAQLDKIADARAMVNGSAESQALGIPKVLTALVSGQGSRCASLKPN